LEVVRKVVGQNHGESMERRQKHLRTNLNGKKELEKPKITKEWPLREKTMQPQEKN
jgi:hypothetical protein